ncbi:MAG: VCBS repeat-containing protein, partial [Phaeodactylibacter sp.]|nr:VCBS repeat-containing protein [Phaeodactylibacter sp.]
MIKRLLPLFLFCSFCLSLAAQPPVVASHFPANLATAADKWTDISATFGQPISPGSVNAGAVKVFGRWSGPLAASVQLSADSLTIIVIPQTPFFAGEWVTVNLTKDIQSAAGVPMGRGYSWNFWVAATGGSLLQTAVDTIALRLPDEVYIQTYGAYAGDLNNDGFSDLAVINEASDDVRILLNDGAGHYSDFSVIPMGNLTPSPNEGADFNGDGEIDLAVSTAHSNEVRILFGDGQGGFPHIDVYNTGAGARGLSVLDCNSDGYDDIFITNRISDNITLLSNYGDGSFLVQDMNTAGDGETACAVADANNDGLPDVFIGSYNSQELSLLLGDGQGGFTFSDAIAVNGRPWMIAAADLNGDGFADVASANSNGNRMAIAFGDGNGQLSAPVHYTNSALLFPLAIDLGDLDGDGDLDIVTSNYSGPTFTVFENDGFGQFTLASTLPAPDKASCAILH